MCCFAVHACTFEDALNYIAPYSDEWLKIGEELVGFENYSELMKIQKNVNNMDHKAYLVELWYRVDIQGLSWDKLIKAVEPVKKRRGSSVTSNEMVSPPLNLLQMRQLSKFVKPLSQDIMYL